MIKITLVLLTIFTISLPQLASSQPIKFFLICNDIQTSEGKTFKKGTLFDVWYESRTSTEPIKVRQRMDLPPLEIDPKLGFYFEVKNGYNFATKLPIRPVLITNTQFIETACGQHDQEFSIGGNTFTDLRPQLKAKDAQRKSEHEAHERKQEEEKAREKVERKKKEEEQARIEATVRKETDARGEKKGDGFSFIGINWTDKPEIVMEKIRQSGYASGDRATWWKEDNGSFHTDHLSSIDPWGSINRTKPLISIGGRWTNQLQRSNDITVKELLFTGKDGSIAKNGTFFFTYKTDILLSYNISINNKVAHFDNTGEGGFYRSLIEKYGKPGRRNLDSRVWSQKDYTLYYLLSPGGERAELMYISEKNLSDYVATIETKRNALEEASKNKQTDAVRRNF